MTEFPVHKLCSIFVRFCRVLYLPVRRFRILSNFVLLLLLLLQLLLLWKLLEFFVVAADDVFIWVAMPVDEVISWNAISYFGNWNRSAAFAEFVCISHWSLNIFNMKSCACSIARFLDTSSNLVALLLSLSCTLPLFIKSLEQFSLSFCWTSSNVVENLFNLFTLSLEHFTISLLTASFSSYLWSMLLLSLGRCEIIE